MIWLCRFSVVVVGLFLTTPTLYADGCRTVSPTYTPTYTNTNYVAPTNYVQQYNAYASVIPYAVPFVQIPSTFYSVAPEIAQATINRTIAEEAARKAVQEMRAEERKQQPATRSYAEPVRSTYVAPEESADPLAGVVLKIPAKETATSPTIPAGTWGEEVKAIMQNRCVKCHGPGDKLDLSNPSLVGPSKRLNVLAAVSHDEDVAPMPPKQKLSLVDIRILRKWAYDKEN